MRKREPKRNEVRLRKDAYDAMDRLAEYYDCTYIDIVSDILVTAEQSPMFLKKVEELRKE